MQIIPLKVRFLWEDLPTTRQLVLLPDVALFGNQNQPVREVSVGTSSAFPLTSKSLPGLRPAVVCEPERPPTLKEQPPRVDPEEEGCTF